MTLTPDRVQARWKGIRGNMTEALKLLQIELQLLTGGLIELQAIKSALKENPSGRGVTDAVHCLETTLNRLALLEKRKGELLLRKKQATLKGCIAASRACIERDSAINLLIKIQGLEDKLKKELNSTRELLARSKAFIDFHVNVITETAASVTYAPPGAGAAQEERKVKMFEANV